jgi:putative addiction module killer protein
MRVDLVYPSEYSVAMNHFDRTEHFDRWLSKLKDVQGKAKILVRIRSAEKGNFGDCESVGEGVSEMRIHTRPGYRVYFTRRGNTVYLLLAGGDKSTQKRDIALAKALAAELGDSHE